MTAPLPSRRTFNTGLVALAGWAFLPRFALYAGDTDRRFLAVVLRGALDGLAVAAPIGDPAYAALRGDLALRVDGDAPALPLDGFFWLNPRMPVLHSLYRSGQAILVHAVASPYRDRSHFDGQDVLESGYAGPGFRESGWLNRAAGLIVPADRLSPPPLAVGATVPLIMRGLTPVNNWMPPGYPDAGGDLESRLLDLYRHNDPELGSALQSGLDLSAKARRMPMSAVVAQQRSSAVRTLVQTARGAGQLMAAEDGPRIAAISFDGWDTHAQEGATRGHLGDLLAALDAAFGALSQTMAPVWSRTVVAVVTEFGRTARANGTDGTDHGTGTIALLIGGGVAGGRVVADWPGLTEPRLYQGRDLTPTTDLRGVLKGVLAGHLGLDAEAFGIKVFPDSHHVRPMTGLIQT